MTLGFVLIFVGIQLNLVDTYVLTPRVSSFLSEQAAPVVQPQAVAVPQLNAANTNYNSPYYQASYSNAVSAANSHSNGPQFLTGPKVLATPSWLCWPVLFLGTVVFLHGLSMSYR